MSSSTGSNAATTATVPRLITFIESNKRIILLTTITTTAIIAAGLSYYYLNTAGSTTTTSTPPSDGNTPTTSEKKKRKKPKTSKSGSSTTRSSTTTAATDGVRGSSAEQNVEERAADDPRRLSLAEIGLMSAAERSALALTLKGKGNSSYSSKRYTEAIEYYSKAIDCEPQAVFYSNRAACYTNLNQPEQVIQDCTSALNIDSSYIKALNRRGTAREQLGGGEQLYQSLCDFTAAAIIDEFKTDSTQVSVERVMKRLAQEQATEMLKNREPRLPGATFIKAYLEAFRPHPVPSLPAKPSQGDKTLMMAFDALTARSYIHAFTLFNEALEQTISTPQLEAEALNMRATFRFIMGDAKLALIDLDRSTSIWPQGVQSYVKKASVHMELGMATEAFHDFEAALQIDPNDPDVFYHRGQVYFITGSYPLAIEEYRQSSVLDPTFIFSHIQLAVALYKQGDVAGALDNFETLLAQHPTSGEVANYYGELLLDQGKFEKAIQMFELSIELNSESLPRNVLPIINHALALFQWKQDFAAAEVLCRRAIEIDPQCDVGIATLAQLLLQQNKVADAMEMFHRSAEMARTEVELVNSLTYENASRAQIAFIKGWPAHAARLGLESAAN